MSTYLSFPSDVSLPITQNWFRLHFVSGFLHQNLSEKFKFSTYRPNKNPDFFLYAYPLFLCYFLPSERLYTYICLSYAQQGEYNFTALCGSMGRRCRSVIGELYFFTPGRIRSVYLLPRTTQFTHHRIPERGLRQWGTVTIETSEVYPALEQLAVEVASSPLSVTELKAGISRLVWKRCSVRSEQDYWQTIPGLVSCLLIQCNYKIFRPSNSQSYP